MFATQLYTLVILAAGLSASAAPASVKRSGSDASPALAARKPQLNNTLPNNLPFAVNVVLSPGAQNTTVGLPFKFKRDDASSPYPSSSADNDEDGVFNFTRNARFPFLTKLPWLVPSNETKNDTSSTFETRQVNATLPNQLPVDGVLPFHIAITPGAQNTTVGVPAGFPFKVKRQDGNDDTSTNDDDDGNLDDNDGVFNFTNHAHLPLWTQIPAGLWHDDDNDNSTESTNGTSGGFPFEFWGSESAEEGNAEKREVKLARA
ncbi:unnamed protein product [Peniophora sp. CBMAI 1063]|nr:unnamed protein product [Peniophora sp. CBMAI 1063]